ncbi:MAG: DNA-directed RNA polymerase subunit beta', partial [Paracoccus sp. (in: a-proteobacteria)]|nr:DNA-directed RNA polymerase subunit beta' [Paracoccus sp. (in: a-proteobacteria)]
KLHQWGLPKKMALELFKPFIYSRLEAKGLSSTVKQAKKLVEKERPEVWDILEEVIREHPVLLNRAPTLHRLGIQAFEPILIEGKAIQLHPLVCSAFNADFDGDQMAVHVPLSLEAQLEARVLMMSTNNVLSPANGAPIIVPSQDMILGLYYVSMSREGMPGEGMAFASIEEVEHALAAGVVHLHTKITSRIKQIDDNGNEVIKRYETTPGRMRLGALLPMNAKAPFELVNRLLRKKDVQVVIDTVYRYCGQKESVIFCDQIMGLGFREAFRAGISFGKDDMVVPDNKWTIVEEVQDQVKEFEQQYLDGLITQGEKYNKVVDAWSKCNDRVTEAMMSTISATKIDENGAEMEPNSVYMMAHSGARGSVNQMKQLGGMRGLMAKPSGEIIETPIISNFKEGLTVLEYFNSTHGARKGLSDTALKTANSGYLTRRLVDVAQDCIIREHDCGTENSITATAAINDGEVISPLSERVLGRTVAEDVLVPGEDEIIIRAGEVVDERKADTIEKAGVLSIRIRSALTCESEDGICALCYGRDLARGTLVNIGEAVGIIAAQSIGEPGTQLTMRTFHIGGIAQGGQQSFQAASHEGTIQFRNQNILANANGDQVVMSRNMQLLVLDDQGQERASHKLFYGSKLFVKEGERVIRGAKLFEWDPYTLPIIAEKGGMAKFVDLMSGISVRDETDDATGMTQKIVTDWRSAPKGNDLKPEIIIMDADGEPVRNDQGNPVSYPMSVDAILSIEDGQEIQPGDVVARIPREGARTKDITGGLPRVAELFEARRPKDHAIIAEMDGYVRFGKDYKNKRRITVEPSEEGNTAVEYMVPKGKHIPVQEGDFVQKGDYIMDGNPAPHDILRIMGIEALADYLIDEVQDVYRLQGVKINDKHIEVIVRQMLQKIEIIDSGETTLLKGEHVERDDFEAENAKIEARGGRPATGEPVLLGITKASLQTRSFISAASFQETTRVLTEAAVQGKRDKLVGLKENVIVGRLIPAGTGGATARVRRIATERDSEVIEARRADAEAAAALAAPEPAMEASPAAESQVVDLPESNGDE